MFTNQLHVWYTGFFCLTASLYSVPRQFVLVNYTFNIEQVKNVDEKADCSAMAGPV